MTSIQDNWSEEAPKTDLVALLDKRGISNAEYHTLQKNLYPGADPMSVVMVIDYCQARGLDPLKKPCHIVPMKVKDARTGQEAWRDVVMPGIYEYRTTAQRTGEYLGQARPVYGEIVDYKGIKVPEWCELTVYRWNKVAKQRSEFTVLTYFSEVVSESWAKGQKGVKEPNSRWQKAPRQMLTKCTEAAALRMAFPDELGGEMTMEEAGDRDVHPHGVRDVEAPESDVLEGTATERLIQTVTNRDNNAAEAATTAEEAKQ